MSVYVAKNIEIETNNLTSKAYPVLPLTKPYLQYTKKLECQKKFTAFFFSIWGTETILKLPILNLIWHSLTDIISASVQSRKYLKT